MSAIDRPMRRLFQYLNRYRLHLYAASISSIICKIFDLMPPLLTGWLVAAVTHQPPQWMITLVGSANPWHMAILIAGLTIIIFGVESLSQWGAEFGFRTLAQKAQHDLRLATYENLQDREIAFFEQHRLGDTLALLNDDVNQLERFLNTGVNEILSLMTLVIFSVYVLFSTSWQLATIAFAPVPIIIASSFWFQATISPRYRKMRDAVGALAARLENNLSGIMVIKSFTAEKFEASRVAQASQDYVDTNYQAIKLNTLFVPIIRMAISLGFAGVLLFGSYWVLQGSDVITVGGLVVFSMLTQRMLWPLTRLGQTFDDYARAKASAIRTFGLLQTKTNITDPPHPTPLNQARGDIDFHHVSFKYHKEIPIITNLNFSIKAGETVGIAGQTGAGKSTVVKLLLRLYDVTDGSITLDGVDLRQYRLSDLRRNIALVSQDVYLFHGTIYENIAYGNSNASLEHVKHAAKSAHLDQFIESLPNGYDTIVGERGIKLSGGQRQRLSIARAILKDAPILIFDEATSSVDSETEREIQANLAHLTAGKTALIIAHRLSTIRDADRILVLRNGGIIEQGSHDSLIGLGGNYAELWLTQTGGLIT